MKTMCIATGALCLSLCCLGCPDEPRSLPDSPEQDFAEISIRPDNDKLLFTYLQADGSFATTEQMDEVPEKAREQVIVVDTRLSPEQRQSGQILYVADLSQAKEDGSYPYSLVSRFKFERDLMRDPAAASGVLPPECEALTESPADRVLLYKTDWCGVCKAAESFLRDRGIPYENKDVEKDPQAQRELACKALRARKQLSGVPVLDVGGQLMLGFDANRLLELSRKLKKGEPESSTDSPPTPAKPRNP